MCASRVRRSVVAIATAGLLGFAGVGCTSSDDPPEPAPLPTETSSPSRSTAAAPSLPPSAEGANARALKAFARHYFDVINYAIATGDTAAVREFASPRCESCNAIAKSIDTVYDNGGHIESEGWRINYLRYLGKRGANRVISIGVFLSPETIVSADGSVDRNEGGKQPMMMLVSTDRGSRVEGLDLVT